ncbi:uncharacterized protein LOC107040188 [Diachasma alloeum]|uniref:uncharacterized protein LOC107040188 n=1 Tax=Diachasma alloeum TaxID=454923 RepID=UPI00073843B8|nr:uncharacterized protein LOC107040188 [Diachasma alloeum]
MRSYGLIAAFAAILISHAGATNENSAEAMIELLPKTVKSLLDYKTVKVNNVTDIIAKDYKERRKNALAASDFYFILARFKEALDAAREKGRNAEGCVDITRSEVNDMRDKYLIELQFCRIEHKVDYRDVETKLDKWEKKGKDLQATIRLNTRCYEENCRAECNSRQCASLKNAVGSWQSVGARLKAKVQRLIAREKGTRRCFNISEFEFKKRQDTLNSVIKNCIAETETM